MRNRLILSANAVCHQGGQGLNLHHMIQGLGGMFELEVFCKGGETGANSHEIPASQASELIGKIPILRRRRDWQGLLSETHFDRMVSSQLRPAEYFQGTTGQCLNSLETAKRKGSFTLLDVVTVHNEFYQEQSSLECAKFGMPPLQHPNQYKRVVEEYEKADAIRVMSEPARQTFLDRGFPKERIFAAPPPFDLSSFPRAAFDCPRFTVSFVGLLEPAKGFHYLIDAFRKLGRADSELLLWGNTGARPLARYVGEQMAACPSIQLRSCSVSLLGYEKVYGISSVLVHPSLADGFGYVVGEAMASGIPVITTPTTGASEWVIDGVNGYLVEPRDSDAICDRLAFLIDHPSKLREMGQAARETIGKLTIDNFRQCYRAGISAARKDSCQIASKHQCLTSLQ